MRSPWRSVVSAVVLAAIVAGGCGDPTAGSPPVPGDPAAAMQEIRLVAQDIAFTPLDVGAPAGAPLHLVLDNRDSGVPHNVALIAVNGSKLAETEVVPGVAEATVDVPGLIPGVYQLMCSVHPTMVTTLTVGG